MKSFFLTMLVVVMGKSASALVPKPDGLFATCKNQVASLTVPTGYFASSKGNCIPATPSPLNAATSNVFSLPHPCVNGSNAFIITNSSKQLKVYDMDNLVGEFVVDCSHVADGTDVEVVASFTPTITPEPVYSAIVEMKLLSKQPNETTNLKSTPSVQTFTFGETMYLTIFETNGHGQLYPQLCSAEGVDLYKVDRIADSAWTCTAEKSIISDGFKKIATSESIYSKMSVFEVPGKEDQLIKIKCTVRLCDYVPTPAPPPGACQKANQLDTTGCSDMSKNRRRREAILYDTAQDLHQVSATFRVGNGPLGPQTDSSSGQIKYTFTTIMAAVVAMFLSVR